MSSFANTTRPASSSSSSAKTGSTARQGPHHGAQKSTTTGVSARRTSCSKVASVSSSTATMLQAAGQRPEPKHGHLPDRLDDDAVTHLRATFLPVDEADRHLDHAKPRAHRAIGG